MESFDKHLSEVQKIALQARKLILENWGQLKQVREKQRADLVSESDLESEKIISQGLQKKFPKIGFLGEEQGNLNDSFDSRWIVDPLDGTTNYIHQLPLFGVSIALEQKGEIVLGVIDFPVFNQTYYAVQNKGSFLNGKKIQVSQREMKDALFCTGFSSSRYGSVEPQFRIFEDVLKKCRGVRLLGSSVYHLCLVAQGLLDGFWDFNLKIWDVAAGFLIVSEAGGKVSHLDGKKFSPKNKTILASSPQLHLDMLELIQKATKN